MSCSNSIPPKVDGCKPIRRRPIFRITGRVRYFNPITGEMVVDVFNGQEPTSYEFTVTGKELERCIKRQLCEGKGVSFKI